MRNSDFTLEIDAIVDVLQQREFGDNRWDVMMKGIGEQLRHMLDDEFTPEQEWRRGVAVPLGSLATIMRDVGTHAPRIESLAAQLNN